MFLPGNPGKGSFCNLQMRTSTGLLTLRSASLLFNNGQRLVLAPGTRIGAGEQSGSIALTGAPRGISGAELVFTRDASTPANAFLSLWGDTSTFGQSSCLLTPTPPTTPSN